jgi:hypothetical protein
MKWNGMKWNRMEWNKNTWNVLFTGLNVAQYSTPYRTSRTSKHTSNWYHRNEGKSLRSSFLYCRRQRPPMISDC